MLSLMIKETLPQYFILLPEIIVIQCKTKHSNEEISGTDMSKERQ